MVPYCVNQPANQDSCMRIGIRSAISALVLTSIVVSAVGVHLLWWRTAQQVSQTLADTINDQIVSAVGDELQSITTEARSSHDGGAHAAGRKGARYRATPGSAKFVFLSQLAVAADHFLGGVRMAGWVVLCRAQARRWRASKCSRSPPDRKLRIDRYEYRRQRHPAQEHAASRTPNIPSPIRNGFARLSRPTTNTGRR